MILNEIGKVITDAEILHRGWISRQGFIFTGITYPANIYDAIVIKHPQDVRCFSPVIKESSHNLEEQIELINREKIEKAMIIAENIDFITKCPTLRYLRIIPAENAGDGFDYSPLYEMPEIKSLQCSTVYGAGERFFTELDCERIIGLRDIHVTSRGYRNYEKISTLKSLELSGSNELPDLSFLKTMKSLKTFVFNMNVKDGNLSLCTGLSYVYSERNRKHYNLKNTELPKGQYVRGNEDIEVWRRCE